MINSKTRSIGIAFVVTILVALALLFVTQDAKADDEKHFYVDNE